MKGSCDLRVEEGVCVEFYKGFRFREVERMCADKGGAFSRKFCEVEDRIAVCQKSHQGRLAHRHYYFGHFTALEAELDCGDLRGTQFLQVQP